MQVKVLKVSFLSFKNLLPFFFKHALVDKTKAQKKEESDKFAKADDPKAGADVGKSVNLMSGDANRVWKIFVFFFFRLLPSNFTFLDLPYGNHALYFIRSCV